MDEVRLDGTWLRAVLDAVPPVRDDPPGENGVLELLSSVTRLVECDLTFWHWFSLRPAYQTYAYVEDPSAVAYVPIASRGSRTCPSTRSCAGVMVPWSASATC